MIILLIISVLIIFLLAIGGGSWYFSNKLLRVTHAELYCPLLVIQATEQAVTLERTPTTELPGIYSLISPGSHTIVGEIIASNIQTVTRQIIKTTQPLAVGQRVRWSAYTYHGDPESALGLPFTDVTFPSPLGPMPAWFLAGEGKTWVMITHGYQGTREEGLRVLPVLKSLGFPVLDLCYRNDSGAPHSPDGLYHLGDTEWQDLEAGVQYALAHGAENVVLYGWSMGGNVTQTFLHRSSYATHVQAVILDSPLLNWREVLMKQARDRHLPAVFLRLVMKLIEWRTGLDFDMLDQVRPAPALTRPTLLFHGTADMVVPVLSSDQFAQARPDLVTYQRVNGAEHIQEWNIDQQAYEITLKAFLTRVVAPEVCV